MQTRRGVAEDRDGDGIPDDGAAADGTSELTLEHLQGALLVLVLGHALAVVAFLAEVVTAVGQTVARRLRVSVTWRPASAAPAGTTAAKQGQGLMEFPAPRPARTHRPQRTSAM